MPAPSSGHTTRPPAGVSSELGVALPMTPLDAIQRTARSLIPTDISCMYSESRPRLVVIFGNGFTLDYIKHCGLESAVDTNTTRLLPPPIHVEYLPGTHDELPRQPLWSPDSRLFPNLAKLLRDADGDFNRLCERIAAIGRLNRGNLPGDWTFTAEGPAYELRVYLWYLFKHLDRELRRGLEERRFVNWAWLPIIDCMMKCFSPVFVSYNYDCVLEMCFARIFNTNSSTPVHLADRVFSELSSLRMPLVLKPHGCVSLFTGPPGMAFNWNSRTSISLDIPAHIGFEPIAIRYPPDDCPMLPDIEDG